MQTIILKAPRPVAPIRLENWMDKSLKAAVAKLNAEVEDILTTRQALTARQAQLRHSIAAGDVHKDLPSEADALKRQALALAVREARALTAKTDPSLLELAKAALDDLIQKAGSAMAKREAELRKACAAARLNEAVTGNALATDAELLKLKASRRRYLDLKLHWQPLAEHELARLHWLKDSLGAQIETPFL